MEVEVFEVNLGKPSSASDTMRGKVYMEKSLLPSNFYRLAPANILNAANVWEALCSHRKRETRACPFRLKSAAKAGSSMR